MAKTISPSEPITGGQIGKIGDLLAAQLRKHGKEFPSEAVNQVTRHQGGPLGQKLLAVVREFVDAASNLITRVVKVNRNRTPEEALEATGRKQYVTDSVVAQMPKGEGEETEVVFFTLGRQVSDDELEKEYELRGLIPDPIAQAAANEADPAFADEHPNGTHWKDAEGKWCFAAFSRWDDDERFVRVRRSVHDWVDDWWFAGVRKVTSTSDALVS